MPKCLDCNNTKTFTFFEDTYNVCTYDSEGYLESTIDRDTADEPRDGKCYECGSENIEGDL
jgi:hypothetical protein